MRKPVGEVRPEARKRIGARHNSAAWYGGLQTWSQLLLRTYSGCLNLGFGTHVEIKIVMQT